MRERLDGLSETHIIREHTSQIVLLEKAEPSESGALIGAKLALKALGRIDRRHSPKVPPFPAQRLHPRIDRRLRLRGQEQVKNQGLLRLEVKAVSRSFSGREQKPVTAEPVFRQKSDRTMA